MSTPGPVKVIQTRRFLSTDPGMIERFGDPFRPLEPGCSVIQFDQPLAEAQLQQAGELIAHRPDVQLYVYFDASTDLNFLKYFPALRRLHIALFKLKDIAGFSHVAGTLEELTFDQTKIAFSLRFLTTMPHLKSLFLVRHKKDLPVLSDLVNLTKLGLSGISMADLGLLLPLKDLRDLSIFLGSTTNLTDLPRLAALKELWLMRIARLTDLGMLGAVTGLTKLHLDGLPKVKELPSLARLAQLEEVTLDSMKGLQDLTPVAAALALRKLSVFTVPHLTAESFRCLVGHPTLADLEVETSRKRVDEAVKRLFGGIVC